MGDWRGGNLTKMSSKGISQDISSSGFRMLPTESPLCTGSTDISERSNWSVAPKNVANLLKAEWQIWAPGLMDSGKDGMHVGMKSSFWQFGLNSARTALQNMNLHKNKIARMMVWMEFYKKAPVAIYMWFVDNHFKTSNGIVLPKEKPPEKRITQSFNPNCMKFSWCNYSCFQLTQRERK